MVDTFYLVASSIAALIARSVTYPLDTIKTRLQTKSNTYTILVDHEPTKEKWFRVIAALYRGIGITLLFSIPALTVYLTCYEYSKSYLDSISTWLHKDALMNHALSGCVAELSAGIFFTPMEVIKSQLQIMDYTTIGLVKAIAQHDGIAGFYRGYWMSIAVFLPHSVAYFIVYEQLKSYWELQDQTFMVYLFCSTVASTVGIVISTPLDIIKTRWQVSSQEQTYKEGPVKIARDMWRYEEGPKAFTRGMLVRIAWGIPVTTINMTVFESLLKMHNNS